MLLFEISLEFDRQLKEICKEKKLNSELQEFLLKHPGLHLAKDSCCNQVLLYEKRFRTKLSIVSRNMIIKESAKIFAKVAIDKKIQELQSEAEKYRFSKTNPIKEEMKQIFKEQGA